MVFLAHIVDLHSGEGAVSQTFFESKTRMVRMDMDFNDIVIRNYNDAVTDGLQISFKFLLLVHIISFLHIYDKLGAVAVLNIGSGKIITSRSHLRFCGLCVCGCRRSGIKRDPFS